MRRSRGGSWNWVGGVLALSVLGCGASTTQGDAGLDAGSCTDQQQAATAALLSAQRSCFLPDAGPSPAVTFRLRNRSVADVWVPLHEWFGTTCRATRSISGCQGGLLSATALASELCPEDLVHLTPDASVQLPSSPLVGAAQTATCGSALVTLPAGSYQAQFSYSLDGGVPWSSTAARAFTTPTDGGVVEFDVP